MLLACSESTLCSPLRKNFWAQRSSMDCSFFLIIKSSVTSFFSPKNGFELIQENQKLAYKLHARTSTFLMSHLLYRWSKTGSLQAILFFWRFSFEKTLHIRKNICWVVKRLLSLKETSIFTCKTMNCPLSNADKYVVYSWLAVFRIKF